MDSVRFMNLTFGVFGSSTSSCVVFPFLLLFPKGGWSAVSLAAALLEAVDESRSMMSSQHPGIISLVKRPVVVLKSEMKHPIKNEVYETSERRQKMSANSTDDPYLSVFILMLPINLVEIKCDRLYIYF